jgi:tyrosine-protein kinase Etk/Wzc
MNKAVTLEPRWNPPEESMAAAADDGELSLRDVVAPILEGRWWIAAALLAGLICSIAYVFAATPIFEADALVQVEQDAKSINRALGEFAAMLGEQTTTTAELEILRSRMVIGKVVEGLNLEIVAAPRYFPIVGRAIARHHSALGDVPLPPLLAGHYAWGGEHIEVASLEVPASLLGEILTLEALGQDRYALSDPLGRRLLEGQVGIPAASPQSDAVRVFVRDLHAAPGVQFQLRKLPRSAAIRQVTERVSVTERGNQSGIISVGFEDPDPQRVTAVVNALIGAYQRQNVERRSAEAEQTLSFLKQQLPEVRKDVEASEAALNRFRLKNGSADLTKETELVLQQSVALETQRVALKQKREEALNRFTPAHPAVQTLEAQLHQLEIEQNSIASRVKQLPDTQQELLSLNRDAEVNNQLYTALMNSSQELQVAKAGTVGNVRVVDYALPPLHAAKPRRALALAIGAVLGLLLGVAMVFLRQALRQGVRDPRAVEQKLGLPTYASIPYASEQRRLVKRMRRGKRSAPEVRLLAVTDPGSPAVEALRSLRTSLHFAMLEAGNNIVMLTGSRPAVGKSFVSVNLGAVLAMSGKRVAVVDADLRRGRLHDYLGLDCVPGVSDYVAGTDDLVACVQASGVANLHLVPTGTLPPNPAELLLHERFGQLLATLSKAYDHVLVDTPPVLAVTDAAVIGRHASCALLVLKAGEHPLREIEDTVQRMRRAGVQLRGTLFNQVGRSAADYGYGYGSTYRYDEGRRRFAGGQRAVWPFSSSPRDGHDKRKEPRSV